MKDKAVSNKTPNGCFSYFVDTYLGNNAPKPRYQVNSRTITNYYNKYVKDIENDAGEPKIELKDLIAEYLGYKNYADFVGTDKKKKICLMCIAKYKRSVIITLVPMLIISAFLYLNYETDNCIIWKENHFENTPCTDENALENSVYHIDIERFKKVTLMKGMEFFTDGKPNYWYGSNAKGEREFFTARGVHPETLRELKPITEHILEKEGFSIVE
ncbi:hypothetical protein P8625_02490 [Tenacibaculum tangerinum]|uniref:YARHG domain-containing protein n=1 Tax=Tenacibaculum tangerinum TaxID=3038772 RepID=A0ABY8L6P4_9FLAO|nr:hypothetical protein [Tenacibaculum tangerinum]WGH76053.1 hypothetical protein P8625_02490 [Tenacibaculum tangerinum]